MSISIVFLYAFFSLQSIQPVQDHGYYTPERLPKAVYSYQAKIDLKKGSIQGSGTISFTNTSELPIQVVAINIPQSTTAEIQENGDNLTPAYTTKNVAFFKLDTPLLPGEKANYAVSFQRLFSNTDKELIYFSNWLPCLWWDGLPSNDTYEVKINQTEDYATVVNGLIDEGSGCYIAEGIKTSGLFLARGYKTITAESQGVHITSLYNDNIKQAAHYCLGIAVDAIAFYKEWLGFYPHTFLYILPGNNVSKGGYPWASGAVRIHSMSRFEEFGKYFWTFITAHEIGHQYWGEWVLDGDNPSWLWIGLGIYADRMYTWSRGFKEERGYGLMNRYTKTRKEGYDTTLDMTRDQISAVAYDHNNSVRHGKSISFINALEVTLGREKFQDIYKNALTVYGNKPLGWKEFQRFYELQTGQDLEWLFDQWVKSNNYLRYTIKDQSCEKTGDHFESRITVSNHGTLGMPVPIQALFEDGSAQIKYTNRHLSENVVTFISSSPLKSVQLDPEKQLAMQDDDPQILPEFLKSEVYKIDIRNVSEGIPFPALKTAKGMQYVSPGVWHKLGISFYALENYPEALFCFEKLAQTIDNSYYKALGMAWQGILYDITNDRNKAIEAYTAALQNGKEFNQNYSQWNFTINRQWLEERLAKPFVRQ